MTTPLFPVTPAEKWAEEASKRSLDELFLLARRYRASTEFRDLLNFVAQFRFYSPFNAMLVHVQMPGATYVAPANRWLRDFGRNVRPDAQPLVILQPRGPVMFVFDVSGTTAGPHARPLPSQVTHPFEVRKGHVGPELGRTIANTARDGIEVMEQSTGSQGAGCIGKVDLARSLRIDTPKGPVWIPVRYALLLNRQHSPTTQYATLVHELGHLYCGHLGTPNPAWWPDRRGLSPAIREFEAESVSYLVCQRLGIDNPSDTYLAGYFQTNAETPPISLECVLKTAGLVERMGRESLGLRKQKEE